MKIAPLNKALLSLIKAVERATPIPFDLELRDACIQRFEYTYELCIKMIRRYLETEIPLPQEVDQMNYRDLLRFAYEYGLINRVDDWFGYREARNQTSHAYDEDKAQHVYDILPDFIIHAQFLVEALNQRLESKT